MINVNGSSISVRTKTLNAEIVNGALVSLTDKAGNSYIHADAESSPALELVYRHDDIVPIKNTRSGVLTCCQISEVCAELRFDAWDGTGIITLTEDIETGDLCVEPEVSSARNGVLACRWTIDGIADGLRIVAPFYQGVDMELSDELILHRKWNWPYSWEAGLCILHNGERGFWVHCEDTEYRCKALTVREDRGLSFDSEAWGPIESSKSAGGLVWRVNVFEGIWRVPAGRYRDWLSEAYKLDRERAKRKEWQGDVTMAVSWCPSDAALLDAIAKRVDPKRVLLHLPSWRREGYDTCYPDYTPSDSFKEFMEYASSKGFRCMPHCNSVDMDPSMPEYRYLTDFKYREIEGGRLLGWGWDNGRVLGVPSSNKALSESRDKNVMVKIHPGLAVWRSILAESIKNALGQLDNRTDTVFIDVTLCSYNLENCLVDNTTTMEGMSRIIKHIGAINGGLAVGGEGLNEITMQGLSFAQAHLFDSHHGTRPGLERCGGCDLNALLFDGLTRTIGYSNLSGSDENQVMRERIHEEHGAIPTLTVSDASQIESPNAEVERVLKRAAE